MTKNETDIQIKITESIETLNNGDIFKVTEYTNNQYNKNSKNMAIKKNTKKFPARKPISEEEFLTSFSGLSRIQATKLNVHKQISQLMKELEERTRNLNEFERDIIVKDAYILCKDALYHIHTAYANMHRPKQHLQHLEIAKQKLCDCFCRVATLYQIGNISKKVSQQLFGTMRTPIDSLTNMIEARHREINNLKKSSD